MLVGVVVVMAMCVTTAWAGDGGPIQGDRWWNAVVAVILFVVLLVILGRYAWKPVLRAMQAREQALADIVSETERRKTEGEEMLAEYRARLQAAEDDVATMLQRAQDEAEKTRQDIVQHAKKQAAASIAEAERQILAAKQEAIKEIYRNTADLATDMAGKIVRKEITPADQDRLIEESLGRLGEDEK
jgi:F-type H+-transporting ATPase subunit b